MTRPATSMTRLLFGMAVFGIIATAEATAENPWYVAAGGTVSAQGDNAGSIANAPMPGLTIRLEEHYDPGVGGFFALGRTAGRFRIEGELGYTRDTADRYTAIAPPAGEILADIRSETLRAMANVFVDFELGGLEPYLGAGAGYASTDLRVIGPRAVFPTEQARLLIEDEDSGFAYQAMAGLSVPVNERLSFTLGYRWFDEGRFVGVDGRNQEVTRERGTHNIDVGLRWSF